MFVRQQADVDRLNHVYEFSSMCTAAMSQGHAAHCYNILNLHQWLLVHKQPEPLDTSSAFHILFQSSLKFVYGLYYAVA